MTNKVNWPQHQNPSQPRSAVAPYNFVPLPQQAIRVSPDEITNHDRYEGYTGYIDCKLLTLTPLYTRTAVDPEFYERWGEQVRDIMSDDGARKHYAKFFHIRDAEQPVIPGSTLRGMIRSIVEIISYGKIQWVTDTHKLSFRAVAAPGNDPLKEKYEEALGKNGEKVRAGYVRRINERWYIQPALTPEQIGFEGESKPYLQVKQASLESGDIPGLMYFDDKDYLPQYHDVSIKTERRPNKNNFYTFYVVGNPEKEYPYTGTLICSGNMDETGGGNTPRKKYAVVLAPDLNQAPILIDEQAVQDYRDSLTDFQRSTPFDPNWGCLVENNPIFYVPTEQGRVIYFGHTPNFRIPMRNEARARAVTPMDLTPLSLREVAGYDLVDSIFGYVRSDKQLSSKHQSHAGRVYFSDAKFVSAKHDLWLNDEPVTPKILASPKPTTFQHYLVQDTNHEHDPNSRPRLAHYGTPSPEETVIRGHKQYWHKRGVTLRDFEERDDKQVEEWSQDTQHTQIRPVNKDVRFSFRINFENLQPVELGALLWAISLPADDNTKQYRHKVGMGKPLGLGSIEITPELVLSDRKDRHRRNGKKKAGRYRRLFDKDTWYTPERRIKNIDRYIQAFESFVLNNIHESESMNVKKLAQINRISMMLKLLEWSPGIDASKTRYMTIEPNNEYSDRPVLPTPLGISREHRE